MRLKILLPFSLLILLCLQGWSQVGNPAAQTSIEQNFFSTQKELFAAPAPVAPIQLEQSEFQYQLFPENQSKKQAFEVAVSMKAIHAKPTSSYELYLLESEETITGEGSFTIPPNQIFPVLLKGKLAPGDSLTLLLIFSYTFPGTTKEQKNTQLLRFRYGVNHGSPSFAFRGGNAYQVTGRKAEFDLEIENTSHEVQVGKVDLIELTYVVNNSNAEDKTMSADYETFTYQPEGKEKDSPFIIKRDKSVTISCELTGLSPELYNGKIRLESVGMQSKEFDIQIWVRSHWAFAILVIALGVLVSYFIRQLLPAIGRGAEYRYKSGQLLENILQNPPKDASEAETRIYGLILKETEQYYRTTFRKSESTLKEEWTSLQNKQEVFQEWKRLVNAVDLFPESLLAQWNLSFAPNLLRLGSQDFIDWAGTFDETQKTALIQKIDTERLSITTEIKNSAINWLGHIATDLKLKGSLFFKPDVLNQLIDEVSRKENTLTKYGEKDPYWLVVGDELVPLAQKIMDAMKNFFSNLKDQKPENLPQEEWDQYMQNCHTAVSNWDSVSQAMDEGVALYKQLLQLQIDSLKRYLLTSAKQLGVKTNDLSAKDVALKEQLKEAEALLKKDKIQEAKEAYEKALEIMKRPAEEFQDERQARSTGTANVPALAFTDQFIFNHRLNEIDQMVAADPELTEEDRRSKILQEVSRSQDEWPKLKNRIEMIQLLLSGVLAIVIGLYLLWSKNLVWGTWEDYILAFLWGLGIHQGTSSALNASGVTNTIMNNLQGSTQATAGVSGASMFSQPQAIVTKPRV